VPRETQAQAGRRLALLTLVDRIADAVDLAALKSSPVVDDTLAQHIERTAREQAGSMRDDGEAPEGLDVEQLAGDATRELVGLGALGALLDDEDVTEIQCVRNDQLLVARAGQVALADVSFTSDEALGRAIARLAHGVGEPLRTGESVIERRLARGAHLLALAPPSALGHSLVIRKRRRVDASLEDLIRSSALSRPMAVFLDACVQARANILVSAPADTSTALFVAALASAAPPGERVALLSDIEEVVVSQALVYALSLSDRRPSACEEVVRAASRLHPDRLIVSALPTGVPAALLEAIGEGAEGVIAAGCAPSLRQLLARFASQTMMSRPGIDVDTTRECLAEAFDVAVEVTTLADGRLRVLRVAEMGAGENRAPRDLFVFTPDASGGDGTFQASGAGSPRLVNEFAARGVKLDPAVFKRAR
jgi:pilus assembly protein CpaF